MKHAELAELLLGDDPTAIIVALKTAISEGADFADLGRSLCYAAALRIARFGSRTSMGIGRPRITFSLVATRCIKG